MKKLLLLICVVIIGCTSATDNIVIDGQILTPVPILHVRGGECFHACIAMVAGALRGFQPTQDHIQAQINWLGFEGPVLFSEGLRLTREFWGLDGVYKHLTISQMYARLSAGQYLVAFIDGWEHYHHAVVVVGVDEWFVYTVDPVGGARYYTWSTWESLHIDSRNRVLVVRGEIN